jgi:hypothetical protein
MAYRCVTVEVSETSVQYRSRSVVMTWRNGGPQHRWSEGVVRSGMSVREIISDSRVGQVLCVKGSMRETNEINNEAHSLRGSTSALKWWMKIDRVYKGISSAKPSSPKGERLAGEIGTKGDSKVAPCLWSEAAPGKWYIDGNIPKSGRTSIGDKSMNQYEIEVQY